MDIKLIEKLFKHVALGGATESSCGAELLAAPNDIGKSRPTLSTVSVNALEIGGDVVSQDARPSEGQSCYLETIRKDVGVDPFFDTFWNEGANAMMHNHKPETAVATQDQEYEQEAVADLELEKRTLRKFDLFVLPQFMLMVLIAYLDRSNIGNAKIFGFEDGLGLTGHQFNDISTVFYATYVVFEVPWVMALKKYGANTVLAVALVSWSTVTLCTGFIHNYTQAIVMRLLLGAAEAGLFPALAFIISTVWDRKDQAKRVSLLYMSSALSGAFGGLIAYGIQTMGRQKGLDAWRWLFIIEGAVSLFLCGIAWFSLPKSAEEAWFLSEQEKAAMQARKARNAWYKGSDEFSWRYVKQALTDPFVYASAALLFCSSIPLFGYGTFLPTIIQGLGYDGLAPNYLSIPCYVLAAISLISWTTLSDKLQKRALFAFLAPIPCVIGYAIAVATPSPEAGYAAMFLCAAGIYPYNAIMFTWLLNNLSPDWKRSVGAPLFASLANISGVISSQIYAASDSPRYLKGNAISLAMETIACGGVVLVWWLLKRRDRRKEELRAQGVEDNRFGDEDRGLHFKYAL